jgi:hypothetical protein
MGQRVRREERLDVKLFSIRMKPAWSFDFSLGCVAWVTKKFATKRHI